MDMNFFLFRINKWGCFQIPNSRRTVVTSFEMDRWIARLSLGYRMLFCTLCLIEKCGLLIKFFSLKMSLEIEGCIVNILLHSS